MRINVNGKDYPVVYIYKPTNRNFYIKYKDGNIVVTGYGKFSEKQILDMLNKNMDIVYKLISKVENDVKKNQNKTNSIHLFGVEYEVNKIPSCKDYIEIKNGCFNIYYYREEFIEFTVKEFLFESLERYIRTIEDEAFNDFKDIVKYKPVIEYKDVNSYYGKCYMKRNLIILNINLARYDKLYIKSVLYHEYTHFKYPNHQEEFYSLYEDRFKHARMIQTKLKTIKYNDLY